MEPSVLGSTRVSRRFVSAKPTAVIEPEFSEEDFQTLSDWLLRRGKGIFDIVELDGFFTAIVIGPNTLSPKSPVSAKEYCCASAMMRWSRTRTSRSESVSLRRRVMSSSAWLGSATPDG
jgi:hypothetical protein